MVFYRSHDHFPNVIWMDEQIRFIPHFINFKGLNFVDRALAIICDFNSLISFGTPGRPETVLQIAQVFKLE
jgi:hypothetical protein